MKSVFYFPEQLSEEPRPVGYPWRIVSAICVQRFPTLVKEKTPLELEFLAMQEQQRTERSRLSDFELEEKRHLEKKAAREKRALEEDVDASQVWFVVARSSDCIRSNS